MPFILFDKTGSTLDLFFFKYLFNKIEKKWLFKQRTANIWYTRLRNGLQNNNETNKKS